MAGVSTLSQLTAQLARFDTLNTQFADLQRALSSNKKTTTYEGLGGADSLSTLRYRTSMKANEQYQINVSVANSRMKSMTGVMDLVQTQVQRLEKGLIQQPVEGETDLSSIKSYAAKLLEIMPGNLNQTLDGRYVFAGADITAKPYEGRDGLAQLVDQDMQDWMDGTITTDTFLTRVNAYTDDEIGFSAEVISAGKITARVSDDLALDYTVKANDQSFKDILVSTEILSRLSFPSETDATKEADFQAVLKAMSQKLTSGSQALEANNIKVQATQVSADEVSKQHKFDTNALKDLISDIEDTDVTETAVKLQNIQLQLQASYQVTAALSSLNLVTFLGPG